MDSYLVFVVIAWIICGVIGAAVASPKGKAGAGFALGVLLGPIGIVVAALLSPSPEIQAERDRQMAWAVSGNAQSSTLEREIRDAALREALRRDPTLAEHDDPETLARLASSVDEIEKELKLRQEVLDLQERDAAQVSDAQRVAVAGLIAEKVAQRKGHQPLDFSGADLAGADLREVDLYKARLSGANLRGADLRALELTGADFSGADLRGARLLNATLRGATFHGVRYDADTQWPHGYSPPPSA